MPTHAWISGLVIAAYLFAALFYFAEVFFRVEHASTHGRRLLVGAAVLQGIALFGHMIARGVGNFANLFESANLFIWFMVVAFLFTERRARITAAGVFITPLAFVISIFMLAAHGRNAPLQQLDQRWLLPHVGSLVLGYAALALSVCFALLYLTGEHLLKSKHAMARLRHFPSLQTADYFVVALTAFGLSMLTAGIVTGVLWSYARERPSPWTDPRIVQSLVAWSMFALYLFVRKVMGWQGSRSKWVIVAGFAVLLVTMLGYRLSA